MSEGRPCAWACEIFDDSEMGEHAFRHEHAPASNHLFTEQTRDRTMATRGRHEGDKIDASSKQTYKLAVMDSGIEVAAQRTSGNRRKNVSPSRNECPLNCQGIANNTANRCEWDIRRFLVDRKVIFPAESPLENMHQICRSTWKRAKRASSSKVASAKKASLSPWSEI